MTKVKSVLLSKTSLPLYLEGRAKNMFPCTNLNATVVESLENRSDSETESQVDMRHTGSIIKIIITLILIQSNINH